MSYCISCGAQLPNHAKFCNECGFKQELIENGSSTEKKPSYNPVFQNIEKSENDAETRSQISAPDKILPLSSSLHETTDDNKPFDTMQDAEAGNLTDQEAEVRCETELNIEKESDYSSDSEAESDNGNNLLRLLSSFKKSTSDTASDDSAATSVSDDSSYADDWNDPYWDDVKPEIDNEIYQIDRSVILKGVGCICALFLVIAYLVYML